MTHRTAIKACAVFIGMAAFGTVGAQQGFTVREAIERSLEVSPDISFSELEFALTVEQYRLNIRNFLPTVQLGYTQNDSVTYGGTDSRFRTLSLGLSQEVFHRGALVEERRIQRAELDVQRRQLDILRDELGREVLQLYLEILRFRQQKEILSRTLESARDQVRIAEEELAVGDITRLDFVDIQLQAQDVEIRLSESTAEEARLTYQLQRSIDLPVSEETTPRGRLRLDYSGILTENSTEYYLDLADRKSLELTAAQIELRRSREQLRLAQNSWIPGISTEVEFSASGDRFPLTEPGFSASLAFSWDVPVAPTSLDLSIQRTAPYDRSRSVGGSVSPGDNLVGLQSERAARLQLMQVWNGIEEQEEDLEFSIQQQLMEISVLLSQLELQRDRRQLEEEQKAIQMLLLELGELRRIDFVESEIERAESEITLIDSIVSLFNTEIELLAQCGQTNLADYHEAIISDDTT